MPPIHEMQRLLAETEIKLLELLAERTRLVARIAAERKKTGKPFFSPEQEKELWKVWKDFPAGNPSHPSLRRKLFQLLNAQGYELGERLSRERSLAPRLDRAPLHLDAPGPGDRIITLSLLAQAVLRNARLTLPNAYTGDQSMHLAKALNQMGASVTWGPEGFSVQPGAVSPMGKTVFVGHDLLDFCLCLCVCLPHAGSMKFTGGALLRDIPLSRLQTVCTQMGARLAPLDLQGQGLPLRLESSGVFADELHLPSDTPEELRIALAATLPAFSGPVRVHGEGARLPSGLERFVEKRLACIAVADDGTWRSRTTSPDLPERLELPLDVLYSSFLLALPAFCGGQVRLTGEWPQEDPRAKAAGDLLQTAMEVETELGAVTCRALQRRARQEIRLSDSDLFPLAAALACVTRLPLRLQYPDQPGIEQGLDILSPLRPVVAPDGEDLTLRLPQSIDKGTSLFAPTPEWAMAAVLLSFELPGLHLANPELLLDAAPAFWHALQTRIRLSPPAKAEPEIQATPRRRIVVDR